MPDFSQSTPSADGSPSERRTQGLVRRLLRALGSSQFARRFLGTVLTSGLITLLNVVSGVVLARELGPDARGDLAIAMLWPVLLAGLGGLGIAEAITFFVGRDHSQSGEMLSTSLILGVLQTMALVGIGFALIPLLLAGKSGAVVSSSLFYLWVIPLFPLASYPLAVLQGRLMLGRYNGVRASVHAVYTVSLLALAVRHLINLRTALDASLSATAVTTVLALAVVGVPKRMLDMPSLLSVRRILAYGIKLHLGNVASLLVQRVDLVALAVLSTSGALGNYVVAAAVGITAGLIPGAASVILFPVFSSRESGAAPHGVARFLFVAGLLTITAGPIFAVVLPVLVAPVFGQAFAGAVPVAFLLVLGYLVRGWNQMLASILRGMGHPIRASAGEFVGLIVLSLALAVLVPPMAAVGAGIAVLLGACAMFIWVVINTWNLSRLTVGQLRTFWVADYRSLSRLFGLAPVEH